MVQTKTLLRPFQILPTFNVFADYSRAKTLTLYTKITPFAGLLGFSVSILENLNFGDFWGLALHIVLIANITKLLRILCQLSKFLGKIICDDPAATMLYAWGFFKMRTQIAVTTPVSTIQFWRWNSHLIMPEEFQ